MKKQINQNICSHQMVMTEVERGQIMLKNAKRAAKKGGKPPKGSSSNGKA